MKLETPPGTRDFLPEEMAKRQAVIDTVRSIFERYGFPPAETPAFEYSELLTDKYGEEEKLIYKFKDMGGRELALRYDLTVPLVRMFSMNQPTLPFKRYCISRVWRFDRPQKGRYREFWQCDVDIVGVAGIQADAEVVACAIDALEALGLKDAKFKVNNRKLLDALMISVGIDKESELAVFRALDKLEKIGEEQVRKELKGIDKKKLDKLFEILKLRTIKDVEGVVGDCDGIRELKELTRLLKLYGKKVSLDLCMVRGLDYYTGNIFEVDLGSYGSIAGGGRYDRLIGQLSGKEGTPAVGISLGIERIIEVMREKGLLAEKKAVQAYVLRADDESWEEAVRITQELRFAGISAETDLLGRNFSNQMKYADKLGAGRIVIVGQKDLKDGKVTVKDMKTGEQKAVKRERLVESLSK